MDTGSGLLWVERDEDPPLPWLLDAARAAGCPVRTVIVEHGYGRELTLLPPGGAREYPVTLSLVSPRLLLELCRAAEDVVIVRELNLTGLFAVLSKRFRRRAVVALVEGDLRLIGMTGSAWWKRGFRLAVAPFVDVFVANAAPAVTYLRETMRVPPDRIVEGWWMAGLPPALAAGAVPARDPVRGPVLLTAGQLIHRKGVDLLLEAVARYRRAHGPCQLWIAGEGPERAALAAQAAELGLAADVAFLGHVPQQRLAALLARCDLFVLPTRGDLVGRVVVEALSTGTPVVVSTHSGAASTLVHHGEDGLVVDPGDADALAAALHHGLDLRTLATLRAGARRTGARLTPEAGFAVISEAVDRARHRQGAMTPR